MKILLTNWRVEMKSLNNLAFSLIILSGLVITGCASNQQKDLIDRKNITIERVDSSSSHIGKVNVTKSEKGIIIKGEIKKHPHVGGIIPGHIDIDIIGKDGKSKLSKAFKYSRKNNKSKISKFNFELGMDLESNDIIRITHHRRELLSKDW